MDDSKKGKKIERDGDGLIKGQEYHFTEEGLVDWRKMVRPEYLVSNKARTGEKDVTKLEDKDLLILLGGIKELAQIRGFTGVTYHVTSPSPDYVVAVCEITWLPNYETEDRHVTFSAIGDASPNNTTSFASLFLGPIAENRAFVRCVRNFLKINIVGQEEMGSISNGNGNAGETETSGVGQINAREYLKKLLEEKDVPFEKLKDKLIKEKYANAENLNDVDDIPKLKAYELIKLIKKKK